MESSAQGEKTTRRPDGKIPVAVILGPTASGKTQLAVRIAKALDGEVVSADSMQIYRHMDIATAKPTKEETAGVPHHMTDFLEPTEAFSVADYCAMAHSIIKDIHRRKKLPIVAGGTGLYIDALLNNVTFSDAANDDALREELKRTLDEKGVDFLLDEIAGFDRESYERLKTERNPKRIMRCIEVFRLTGVTQTQLNAESMRTPSPYRAVKIGLRAQDRQFLYDRINRRVDEMIKRGLLSEARAFFKQDNGKTAAMAIGYKELKPYLDGEKTLDECVEHLKMMTRRYAKRQMTWFSRDESIRWFDIDRMAFEEIAERAAGMILMNNEG